MLDADFIYSLAIGVAAMCFLLAALIGCTAAAPARRVTTAAAAAVGLGVTWWLYNHPSEVQSVMSQIIDQSVEMIVALLRSVRFW